MKKEDDIWTYEYFQVGASVQMSIKREFSWDTFAYVYPPSFLERIFGVTFKSKLEGYKKKAQAECDRRNREERRVSELLKSGDKKQ